MSRNVTEFGWNAKTERAAVLLAEDALTDEKIASELGITRRTLARWKTHPAFAERVTENVAAARHVILSTGIADQAKRVAAKHRRWAAMERLREERGRAYAGQAPGADTGLIVPETKWVKVYEEEVDDETGEITGTYPQKRVEEVVIWTFDAALERAMESLEEQTAKELGQLIDKKEITGANGQPLFKAYLGDDAEGV